MEGNQLDADGCSSLSEKVMGKWNVTKPDLWQKNTLKSSEKITINIFTCSSIFVGSSSISICSSKWIIIHQMDVVTAFCIGTLEEEIYMEQPQGYTKEEVENLVCKLKRSLYRLKQSSRCWNIALKDYVMVQD